MNNSILRHPVTLFVIGAILAGAFLEPFGNFLMRSILSSSGNLFESYVDRLYENAALGNRNWVAVVILLALFVVYTWMLLFTSLVIVCKENAIKSSFFRRFANPSLKVRILIIAIVAVAWLGSLSTVVSVVADLQLNASFEQRLTVLAPHISEQEEEEFRAAWALMKTRSDYLVLNRQFDRTAEVFFIDLPKPLAGS